MAILYAEFSGQQQFLGQPTPIPNLSLTLPEGVGSRVLAILNVPAAYSVVGSWTNGQGGVFNIAVDGNVLPPYAAYNYLSSMTLQNVNGRVPVTLVVAVPLVLKSQTIVAMATNCIIDSTASLSIIL